MQDAKRFDFVSEINFLYKNVTALIYHQFVCVFACVGVLGCVCLCVCVGVVEGGGGRKLCSVISCTYLYLRV